MNQGISKAELPKRFYKAASVEEAGGGFTVLLDGKPIRTPARRPLAVPSRRPAEAIAAEWEAQGERIDPATMPMTRLVNTVLDGVAENPLAVRDDLARYIETDLLFYRAGEPERLANRERERWDPVVRWAEQLLGARFQLVEGIIHAAQPQASLEAFRARLARFEDPFRIAGLHQITTLTGSALLALAVAEGHLSVEDAWDLAHLDEDWNIEQWGADEEAMARRAARHEEMTAAAELLTAS